MYVCMFECFYDSPTQTVDCMKEKMEKIYRYRRSN